MKCLFFFLLFSLISSSFVQEVYAGPITCVACCTACAVGCAFTLFGAVPCTVACVETICAIPCLLIPL